MSSKPKGLLEILGLTRAPKSIHLDKFHELIEHYTRRAITVPTDRLAACGAVAKEYHPILTGNYLAEHWKAAMPLNLLWHNVTSAVLQKRFDPKGRLSGRPAEYIAPTWSWASMNSAVSWGFGHDPYNLSKWRPVAKVVEASCQPQYNNNPFLQISNGYLILRAPFLEAIYSRLQSYLVRPARTNIEYIIPEEVEIKCKAFSRNKFIPDYDLHVEGQYHLSHGEKLYLVVMAQNQTLGREEQCLVLKHVSGTTADEYWRIGICRGHTKVESKTVPVRNFKIV